MAHYCCSCSNLDTKNKKAGKANGTIYFCKKQKKFVNPTSTGCDKFERSKRLSHEIDEIYKEGKLYSNDTTSMGVYIIILITLIIVGLIFGVFNQF